MMNLVTTRHLRALAAVAMLALVATACDDDDPTGTEQEPETARVVLTIGTGAGAQTVTWNTANQTVTPATITIPAGQSRTVTAQFLRSDNSPDPVITASDFRLDLNVTGAAVTVAKTSNLAATITANGTAGQTATMTFAIHHLGADHREYGLSNAVTVTIQ